MATFEKRGPSSYRITVSCGYDMHGKKIIKRKTVKFSENLTQKQIEKALNEELVLFQKEVENGTFLDGNKITFNEFVEIWFENYALKELREKTLERYEAFLRRIRPAIGHKKLADLQPTHLIQFYRNLEEEGIRLDYKYKIKEFYKSYINKNLESLSNNLVINIRTLKSMLNGKSINIETASKISKELAYPTNKVFTKVENNKELSGKTILHHHRLISSILTKAVQWQLIISNPADRVESPKIKKTEIKFYNLSEVEMFIDLLSKEHIKYQTLISIALFTGLRRGEVLGLDWQDINFEEKTLTVNKEILYVKEKGIFETDYTKTPSSIRTISVPDSLLMLLKKYRLWQKEEKFKLGSKVIYHNDKLFTQENGFYMSPDTPTSWLRKFIKRNNLPSLTYHQLRHTHASILIGQDIDIATISKRLGHADKNITLKTYIHSIEEYDQKASKVLDNLFFKTNITEGDD